jgi:hypothetical protein
MRPNPSLERTRYGRQCKAGLRCTHIVSVQPYTAYLRGPAQLER